MSWMISWSGSIELNRQYRNEEQMYLVPGIFALIKKIYPAVTFLKFLYLNVRNL